MKKCNVGILEAKTKEGKFYLSVVVDKESRYVLGHAFGTEKDKDLVARAVDSVEEEIEFEPGTSLGLFPEIEKYLRRKRQNTYDEAVEALERYIRYYNDSRIHPEIGWTPVSNLSIFEHFCHPIFAHNSIKKAAEAAVSLYYLFIHFIHFIRFFSFYSSMSGVGENGGEWVEKTKIVKCG